MKISANFKSEEFLHPDLVKYCDDRGYDHRWFINKRLVMFCEWLREKCEGEAVVINNWSWGGRLDDAGLRICGTDTGATHSQHKYKSAVDIHVSGYSTTQLREIVVENFTYVNKVFDITTIEKISKTPTWLHVDTRWTGKDYLLEV